MEGLIALFEKEYGRKPDKIREIPGAVSTRRYFRIIDGDKEFIGTYSPDVLETRAFLKFAAHFAAMGLAVPSVCCSSDDEHFYIQTDLGDVRMHEIIAKRQNSKLDKENLELYKNVIRELVKLQLKGHQGMDYSVSVPRPAFDQPAILWDLYHFKYYFLKPLGLPFDEDRLEKAFKHLASNIESVESDSFMFRDFQSRNIMICSGKPFFIDFQGGRMGPKQYDLASLLFESKAGLVPADRELLLNYYLEVLEKYQEVDTHQFRKDFIAVALIRVLQVLGTYGLRGIVEKKAVFIQSIPTGLSNLEYLLSKLDGSFPDPYLLKLLHEVAARKDDFQHMPEPYDGLSISITSFSYRKPLPDDINGNGGGFVYDCRYLANPGRITKYAEMSGLDREVGTFLEEQGEVHDFIRSIKAQLEPVIAKYKERDFRNLALNFGCTGGRHRSVFTAHAIADWCRKMKDVRVLEWHREMDIKF